MEEPFCKPLVLCIGTNHKASPIWFRESVYLDASNLLAVMPEIKQRFALDELLVLSTCNRFEIYCTSSAPTFDNEQLVQVFFSLQEAAGKSDIPPLHEIAARTYCLVDIPAVNHLMSVACSLDSMIVGETQITGQVKTALSLASQAGTLGPLLARLGQEALAAVKKVRSKTPIGEKTVSISHAAIELAKRVFRSLGEQTMVVIGAGEMAAVTAQHAAAFKPRRFYVVNRTLTKAQQLVEKLGRGVAMPLTEMAAVLQEADIVICACSVNDPLISLPLLRGIMEKRPDRLMYLVDIAIPRNIDPRCASLENVYLFDIDDLQNLVDEHKAERLAAAKQAETIIQRAVEQFDHWLINAPIKPALEGFSTYLQDLFGRELSRTLSSGRFRQLSPEQVEGLQKMCAAIAKKMVGDAALALHGQSSIPVQQLQLLAALNLLFAPALARKNFLPPQRNTHATSSSTFAPPSFTHSFAGQRPSS